MKKVFPKLLAVVLAMAMVLSLGIGTLAAEVVRPEAMDDALVGADFGRIGEESLQQASGSSNALGIFALEMSNGEKAVFLTAFMLQKDGEVYLVTDTYFKNDIAQCKLTLKSSANGGYSQKATYLGTDEMFVYLSASGLDNFSPLTAGSKIMTTGQLYVEQVNDGQVGKGLGYLTLNLEAMDRYKANQDGTDLAFFDKNNEPAYLEIGSPILEEGTTTVFAISSAGTHPDAGVTCPCYWSFTSWTLNSQFALDGSSNGGNSNNGGQPQDDGNDGDDGGNSNNGSNNDDRDDNEDDRNDSKVTFDPIWLVIIAIVAVVGYMIYRSNTRNSNAIPKEGTVALDPIAPVQTGETLPLDPSEGTLPLDPGFHAAPAAPQWQLKAVGGSFNGQTFPLTGTLRLGRAQQCQIVFPEGTPGISSNHCEVSLEGGSVVLRDLGSSYGTFGKSGKLAPHTPCHLAAGDTFTLAQGQTFRLESAGAVQSGGTIAVRDMQGREYRTGSGRMSFGRAAGNKIQFPADDKAVSSNHCVLFREDGKLYLMDVGSTNGTFFNENDRLKPNTPYRIRKGMAFFLTNRKNTYVVIED